MVNWRHLCCALLVSLNAAAQSAAGQTIVRQDPELRFDIAEKSERVVLDLLGGIWTMPVSGGAAVPVADVATRAERPRWSPDGRQILFTQRSQDGSSIQLINAATAEQKEIVPPGFGARHADWHPDGARIVFAGTAEGTDGLDLLAVDLRTGLRWRLTSAAGDESEPAWSASGQDLVYVAESGSDWALMLRRFGRDDIALHRSGRRLAAPAWRPDGTLVTFVEDTDDGWVQQMAILSNPPLVRPLIADDKLAPAPIRWLTRAQFFYLADGRIRTRQFDGRRARVLEFSAQVETPAAREDIMIATRKLPPPAASRQRLVIRAGRVFDGLSTAYKSGLDVLIEGDRIAAVTAHRDWGSTPLIDLPTTTLLPGFIDAYSTLPSGDLAAAGADLLSWGITTVVSEDYTEDAAARWSNAATPGPRLLAARPLAVGAPAADSESAFLLSAFDLENTATWRQAVDAWRARGRPVIAEDWALSTALGTNALLGVGALPLTLLGSGAGAFKADGSFIVLSGLADAGTPGLTALLTSRQGAGLGVRRSALRRLAGIPDLRGFGRTVVVGSAPSGLPAGLAMHAELLALAAAGLSGSQLLAAGGANAARLLGLSGQIGEISDGARADLVLVAGDPLQVPADARKIVGVVSHGQFFSLVNLLERRARTVE